MSEAPDPVGASLAKRHASGLCGAQRKIRTRKQPICLSRMTLARGKFGSAWGVPFCPGFRAALGRGVCVRIFDSLSDRKGGGNPPPFPSDALATLRLPRSVTGGAGIFKHHPGSRFNVLPVFFKNHPDKKCRSLV
ncbi:MAG: hypothetical protein ACRC02_05560 [Vogesella sp.]|uniref:hypothetical protein n=1 Tax=Vogesella sp. TaxID=1904252 RepID=UPI003F3FA6C5